MAKAIRRFIETEDYEVRIDHWAGDDSVLIRKVDYDLFLDISLDVASQLADAINSILKEIGYEKKGGSDGQD